MKRMFFMEHSVLLEEYVYVTFIRYFSDDDNK